MLSREGIRVNVTLCFSAGQALLAAKAGAYFVSPFVGRLDDTGWDGMELIRDIVTIYELRLFHADSGRVPAPREPRDRRGQGRRPRRDHAVQSHGRLFNHPLTDKGLDQFLKDYAKAFHTTPVTK